MPPVPVPFEQVERLVQRWFPGPVVLIERMGSGSSTPVYRLGVDDESFYLRLAEEPGEVRQGEVAAHQRALAAEVSVPAIVRFEPAPPELDRSATLTAAMPGIPLSETDVPLPDSALEAIAADLNRFNAIPVRGYGWVDGVQADGTLFAEHASRSAWVAEYQTAMETVVAGEIFAEPIVSELSDAIHHWCDRPQPSHASLAHGDFDPGHIYVDPITGRYLGIIDLGEIRGADHLYDLGHLLAHAFDPPAQDIAGRIITTSAAIRSVEVEELHLQAIAVVTRALGIQLSRPENTYRTSLIARLTDLLISFEASRSLRILGFSNRGGAS